MGREIVYCCQCQRRILGDELDKGTAYQVGNRITCSSCALQVLETLPAKEKETLLAKMFRETKDRQSTPSRNPGASAAARKISVPGPQTPSLSSRRPPDRPAGPSFGLMGGLAVGAIVSAILIWMAVGGSRDPVEAPKAAAPAAPSAEDTRRQAAVDAIRKARDFGKSRSAEIDAQIALWQDAVLAADRTPYQADAKAELEAAKVRQREAMAKELSDLELQTASFVGKQEYKAAQDAIEAARARRNFPDWTVELTRRTRAIEETAAKELVKATEAAAAARRKGFEDEAAAIQSKVASWGLPKLTADFNQALVGVSLPKPLVDAALLGYWPLDEGSGTTAANTSGNLVGRISGAVWTTGKFGSALRFDGADAVLELPNTPELDRLQRGDYTLAAWVKPEGRTAIPGDQYSIIVKAGYNMGLFINHQSRFISGQWMGEKDARYLQLDSANAYDPGQFYHVASTIDATAGMTRVYVNGVVEKEGGWTAKTPTVDYGTTPWRVGCCVPGGTQYRAGAKAIIDEVRIYSRALSPAEVEVLYRARPAVRK